MKRRNLEDEMDLTQESVRDLTGWCIQIALHQCFGVGRQRLIRLNQREYELTMESFAVVMTPDANGRPQGEKARALRAAAVPEGVPKEFRVPVLRAPRGRREQQLRMAGDVAASMVWTIYARACMELLGYSCKRLNRLREETLANYRQVNEEGHESLSWAMERLRRCAEDALKEDITIENVPDEERAKQADRDYQEQKAAFIRRNMAKALGHRAAPAGANVLAPGEIEKKINTILQQPGMPDSWERRRK